MPMKKETATKEERTTEEERATEKERVRENESGWAKGCANASGSGLVGAIEKRKRPEDCRARQ
jgi:hypothetical protein